MAWITSSTGPSGSTERTELKRVQQMLLTEAIFARESPHGLADSIARGVTVSDLQTIKSYLPRIMAVTADDIQRVAKKYFDPDTRVVVWSVPKAGDAGTGGENRGQRTEIRKPRILARSARRAD